MAGDLKDSKSMSDGIMCTWSDRTFVSSAWMCNKQTAVSHSSTEAVGFVEKYKVFVCAVSEFTRRWAGRLFLTERPMRAESIQSDLTHAAALSDVQSNISQPALKLIKEPHKLVSDV